MDFSSTTSGGQIIYAFASSTINIFIGSYPLLVGWFGFILGIGLGVLFVSAIYYSLRTAFGLK